MTSLQKIQKNMQQKSTPLGRLICNLRFADDIDLLGRSEEELQQFTESLEKTTADFGMEINCDKSKIHVNSIKPRPSTNLRSTETKYVTSLKEAKIRLAQAHSAIAKLAAIWRRKKHSFASIRISLKNCC